MSLYEILAKLAHDVDAVRTARTIYYLVLALHVPFIAAWAIACVAKQGVDCPINRSSRFLHVIASLYQTFAGRVIATAFYAIVFIWGLALVAFRVVSIIELGSLSLGEYENRMLDVGGFFTMGAPAGVCVSIWCVYTVWGSHHAEWARRD